MYELTIVTDGEASANKVKSVDKDINELVKVLGGKVIDTDKWGKKDLVYKIGKSTTGNFTLYSLELNAEATKELPAKLNLNEDVIRYLLVSAGNAVETKKEVKNKTKKKTAKKNTKSKKS